MASKRHLSLILSCLTDKVCKLKKLYIQKACKRMLAGFTIYDLSKIRSFYLLFYVHFLLRRFYVNACLKV